MKLAVFDPFFGQFSHFSAIFFPFSRWGPKSIFQPFFSHIGPEADLGSVFSAIAIATPEGLFKGRRVCVYFKPTRGGGGGVEKLAPP